MQQPGKDELGKLIGRAVDKLQDKADKEEVSSPWCRSKNNRR
jgi:hypothetical protein